MKKIFFIAISLITSVLIAQAAFANPSQKFTTICSSQAGSVRNGLTVTKYLDSVAEKATSTTAKYITMTNGRTYALQTWKEGVRKSDAAYLRQLVREAFFRNKKIDLCVKAIHKAPAPKTVIAAEVNV